VVELLLAARAEMNGHGRRAGGFSWQNPIEWWIYDIGVSENSVPLNPMVLLINIPIKWL